RHEVGAHGLQLLLDGQGEPAAPRDNGFRFDPYRYETRNRYSGGFRFRKHYYAAIGDMKPTGDEFACAQAIDALPEVKHWVRNVDRTSNSYWLPTSTDRFYPDFVAELSDGRLFVIEYKGQITPDAIEKDNIGRKLEEASGGAVLFLMALKRDNQGRDVSAQLKAKIDARARL